MVWSVRYECPGGAHFTFYCYCHWATMVVRNTSDGSGHFLHRKLAHFRELQLRGPAWGYYPEPTKSILVVAERNVPRAKECFRVMVIQVVMGSPYLGGFVG